MHQQSFQRPYCIQLPKECMFQSIHVHDCQDHIPDLLILILKIAFVLAQNDFCSINIWSLANILPLI